MDYQKITERYTNDIEKRTGKSIKLDSLPTHLQEAHNSLTIKDTPRSKGDETRKHNVRSMLINFTELIVTVLFAVVLYVMAEIFLVRDIPDVMFWTKTLTRIGIVIALLVGSYRTSTDKTYHHGDH